MTTRKQSAAAKAKKEEQAKADATEAQDAPVPEASTPVDAVAPNVEQEAQASAEAATTTDTAEAEAAPVTETPPHTAEQEAQASEKAPTEIQGNTVTGDGTGNALPPMLELPGVFVRTKRRIKSRRRAGFRFNREGMGIALELLSEEQLKQLREDPALEVEDCTFPLAEAESEEV